MYRGLAVEQPRTSEEDWAFPFEAPHYVTLGLLYEDVQRAATFLAPAGEWAPSPISVAGSGRA